MNRLSFVAALVLSFVAADMSEGAFISIVGDAGDGTVGINGIAGDYSLPTIRVGVHGNDVSGVAAFFFFALPQVSSPAAITATELNLTYVGISQFTVTVTPEFNTDLFGLGARFTPTILASDYYDGDASFGTGTLLVQGFVTPTTAPGSLQVSSSGFLNYLTSLYNSDGTPIAAYAVFRLNPNVDLPIGSSPYRGYEFASADHPNGAFAPQLNLTVSAVPAPSTFVLVLTCFATVVVLSLVRSRWAVRSTPAA